MGRGVYYTLRHHHGVKTDPQGMTGELSCIRSLKAEGKEQEFLGASGSETEWVDDYTLKVMQRCPVARALPDVVELRSTPMSCITACPGIGA